MKPLFLMLFLMVAFSRMHAQEISDPARKAEVLKQMQLHLAADTAFAVKFTQERHLSVMPRALVSRGVCLFRAPDRLRWEVTTPWSSVLVYNQGETARFTLRDKKLQKQNAGGAEIMGKILQQIAAWMQGDFSSSEALYRLQLEGRASGWLLSLQPRSEKLRQTLQRIELHFDRRFEMQQVVIRESADDFVRLQFQDKQYKKVLSTEYFDTSRPRLLESP